MAEIDNFLRFLNERRDHLNWFCDFSIDDVKEIIYKIEQQYLLDKKEKDAENSRALEYRMNQLIAQQQLVRDLTKKHENAVALFNDLLQQKDEEIRKLTNAISELTTINENITKAIDDVENRKKDFYGAANLALERLAEVTESD